MAHIHQTSYQVSDVPDIPSAWQASIPGFSGGNGHVTDYMGDQRSSSGNTSHQGVYRSNNQSYSELFPGSTLTGLAQIDQRNPPLNLHQYTPDPSQSTTYPQSDDNRKQSTSTQVAGYQDQCNHEPFDPFALNVNQNQAIRVMLVQASASTALSLPTGHGFRYAVIIKIS
jgi:hypothetical protein